MRKVYRRGGTELEVAEVAEVAERTDSGLIELESSMNKESVGRLVRRVLHAKTKRKN